MTPAMDPKRRRTGSVAWAGAALLACVAIVVLLAPVLAPQPPNEMFSGRVFAPPMRVHVRDAAGFHLPYVYRQTLDAGLDRRFREDTTERIALNFGAHGRAVSIAASAGPLLLLGGDSLGRDTFARLLYGARLSLGVTALGAVAALLLGALVGGLAGALGGTTDDALMMVADFVLVLPGVYLVLVLRALLPAVLSTPQVFWLMVLLFGVAGWPHVARGVRAIVAVERASDYAEAARAAGAGPLRVARHLLPAARGFLMVEFALLVPALLVAEATISFLGLGFPVPEPSLGTMLQEAANVNGLLGAPWMLAPAAAIFVIVLGVQLAGGARASANLLLHLSAPAPPPAAAAD